MGPFLATLLTLAFVLELEAGAGADQTYATSGSDDFTIGTATNGNVVRYTGTQSLRVYKRGKLVRYRAHLFYTRSEAGVERRGEATYVADVLPSGELADSSDRDPDYLTVLNQPFAAQLDAATLADLRRLRKPLPFDFPSPFTGSSLHGFLQHRPSETIGNHRGVAIRFEAAGAMNGALPDRSELVLDGTIAMRGTAYYDVASELLLALTTKVTISGTVSSGSRNDRVRIVYARSLRAIPSR